MSALGSIQPSTFAQPVAYYSAISARCVCEATISLTRTGEWVHRNAHSMTVWCRSKAALRDH